MYHGGGQFCNSIWVISMVNEGTLGLAYQNAPWYGRLLGMRHVCKRHQNYNSNIEFASTIYLLGCFEKKKIHLYILHNCSTLIWRCLMRFILSKSTTFRIIQNLSEEIVALWFTIYYHSCPTDKRLVLLQIMAWWQAGDTQFPESVLILFHNVSWRY